LKKRIADVVTAQVQSQSGDTTDKVKPNSLRLWIGRDKNTLLESFSAISKAAQQMEVDTPNGTNNSEGKLINHSIYCHIGAITVLIKLELLF
jgi:hypothetical protein